MKNDKPPAFGDHGRRDITTRSWFDPWRQRTRTFTYRGACVACRRATWDADDGENDPRGVLGDHASHALVAAESGADPGLPDVPVCAICGNDYDRYQQAVAVAESRWRTH
jgi:hypothetical protein